MTPAARTSTKVAVARSERLQTVTAAMVRERPQRRDVMQTMPRCIVAVPGTGRKRETPSCRRVARKVFGKGARR
jgi:hypothetical protein